MQLHVEEFVSSVVRLQAHNTFTHGNPQSIPSEPRMRLGNWITANDNRSIMRSLIALVHLLNTRVNM